MVINIQATNMDLTDSIRDYVEDKVNSLTKYIDNIIKVDIDIGLRSNHHQKGKIYYAEVNVHIPKQMIRMSKDAEDLYKAIDKVRDHLKVEFEKIKGKMRNIDRKAAREMKMYQED